MGSGLNGGQNEIQYIFTIEKAKLICAQEGTDKGIQYANYLIYRDEKLQAIETHSMLPFDLNSVPSLQLLSQQLSTALIEEKTAHSQTKEELKEERQLSEQRKERLDNVNNSISYTACAKEIHSGLSCVVFKYWLVCQGFLSPKGVMPSKDCEDGLFIYEGAKTIVKNGVKRYVSGQWKVTQKGCRVLKERWMKFESTNPNYLADVKIAYSRREKSKGLILGSLFEVAND